MTDLCRIPRNNQCHVIGDRDAPLLNLTISDLLAQTVSEMPDQPAAVFPQQGVRWSYREFSQQVDRLASGLLALGIIKGDRVGIWSPNRVEWLLTQFATARIGAILVCINPAYRLTELEYALNNVSCVALVTARAFKGSDYTGMLATLAPEIAASVGGPLQL